MASKRLKTASEIAQQSVADAVALTEETMERANGMVERANGMIERNSVVRTVNRVAEQSMAEAAAITEDAIAAVEAASERNSLFDMARKVMLAAMGGWALAWNEAEDFVNRLVERGEIAEQDGRTLLREMAEKRSARKPVQSGPVEEVLDRMDIPSKADIEALGAKIAELTAKVEELKRAQS
jgi:polyhydroxyalkanoate synthesis regulator phasin